ncbi:hypothetical protein B296_00035569 [Ensete ventricosum]|uniref:Uncharacterized protein n=1 Tax=Ensete ventricosum TaxID=4639 RepID=A0A426YBK9_ENSVE|nr:hypothetical protein B296_00035569 [Ensete ventricosum]
MGLAPYGSLWRDLRRITTLHFFSSGSLRSFAIRPDEVRSLAKHLFLEHAGHSGSPRRVEMKSRLFDLTYNIIARLVEAPGEESTDQPWHLLKMVRESFLVSGGIEVVLGRWVDDPNSTHNGL